jgi:hypothetical protein
MEVKIGECYAISAEIGVHQEKRRRRVSSGERGSNGERGSLFGSKIKEVFGGSRKEKIIIITKRKSPAEVAFRPGFRYSDRSGIQANFPMFRSKKFPTFRSTQLVAFRPASRCSDRY